LRQGLQGLLGFAEQGGISEILRRQYFAIMLVYPGLKPLYPGLVEQHPGHEGCHFLRRQWETQAQTCRATAPGHTLVEFLKDYPSDETVVQQTPNDARRSPLTALHRSQEHISLGGAEQLTVKEVTPHRLVQIQVMLCYLEDPQAREASTQRLQHRL